MKLKFLFLGRTKLGYLAEGIADFLLRLSRYLPVEEVLIRPVKGDDDRPDEVRAQETARLLAAVKTEDLFVCLDPRGREMSSLELAAWLKDVRDKGIKTICFGLGGPLGLDDEAAHRADLRLCLSHLTLTHELSRLVLLEQIYRAWRLNAGHPYHK